jgi:hypothetical protein
MTTDETLEKMGRVYGYVESRVGSLGQRNYVEGGIQAFENKPFPTMGQDILEEIQDSIAYLAFLHIRIEKIMKELSGDF